MLLQERNHKKQQKKNWKKKKLKKKIEIGEWKRENLILIASLQVEVVNKGQFASNCDVSNYISYEQNYTAAHPQIVYISNH